MLVVNFCFSSSIWDCLPYSLRHWTCARTCTHTHTQTDKKLDYYQSVHSTPGADEPCHSASSYYSGGSSGITGGVGGNGAGSSHLSKINHRSRQVATTVAQPHKFDYHHQSPTDLTASFAMAHSGSNDTFSTSDNKRPKVSTGMSSESSAATTARCGSITTDSHMSSSARCGSNSRCQSRGSRRYAVNITTNPGYQVSIWNILILTWAIYGQSYDMATSFAFANNVCIFCITNNKLTKKTKNSSKACLVMRNQIASMATK